MIESKVTVVIPTYNRSLLLKEAVQSALAQDYCDFQVIVLDNASTDDTDAVVRSFDDPRLKYTRNESNIGLFRNWNRAIEINTSGYLNILQDDDVILPGFIRESVNALETYPRSGFSVVQSAAIDINGAPLQVDPNVVAHAQRRSGSSCLCDSLTFRETAVARRYCELYQQITLASVA